MTFRVIHFISLYLIISVGLPCYYHYNKYSELNALAITLFFFLSLNSLICVWEISLGANIKLIKSDYIKLREKFQQRRAIAALNFFQDELTFGKIFSLKYWTKVWSIYSLFDPSYSNQESFGFFVDVGNGWTTLIPSILFMICISEPILDPKIAGMMGLIKFYQEFYGTCIYYLSYIYNKRYVGSNLFVSFCFVTFSNGIWFICPLLGMYACVQLILTGTYNIFHS